VGRAGIRNATARPIPVFFIQPFMDARLSNLEVNHESNRYPRIRWSGSTEFEQYPDPVPGPGEVLVRVAATSVNPIDYKQRARLTKDFYPIKFPGLTGVDLAGTVVKIGPAVEGFSVGDRVFAMADNTYAELCVVNAAILTKIPKGLDLIRAAALPLVTTTGNQLLSATGVKGGQRLWS
jgi:NADPH:quinone reductase-like Zn-dependent oxidoreductase